jgi:hypothetical protein
MSEEYSPKTDEPFPEGYRAGRAAVVRADSRQATAAHLGLQSGLAFRTAEHGAASPDNIAQAICATDAAGRWAIMAAHPSKIVAPEPRSR